MKIAVFDFDGTLYPSETMPYLFRQYKEHGTSKSKYYRMMLVLGFLFGLYKLKVVKSAILKEKAMVNFISLFAAEGEDRINAFFQMAYQGMKKDFNEDILKEARSLKERGHVTVVVSGACAPLLEALRDDYGFDMIIGTEVPFKEGCFDASSSIRYISGEEKTTALLEKLPVDEVNFAESYAYADSFSDVELLELVGHAIAVSPEAKLYQLARERKWRVLGPPKN